MIYKMSISVVLWSLLGRYLFSNIIGNCCIWGNSGLIWNCWGIVGFLVYLILVFIYWCIGYGIYLNCFYEFLFWINCGVGGELLVLFVFWVFWIGVLGWLLLMIRMLVLFEVVVDVVLEELLFIFVFFLILFVLFIVLFIYGLRIIVNKI